MRGDHIPNASGKPFYACELFEGHLGPAEAASCIAGLYHMGSPSYIRDIEHALWDTERKSLVSKETPSSIHVTKVFHHKRWISANDWTPPCMHPGCDMLALPNSPTCKRHANESELLREENRQMKNQLTAVRDVIDAAPESWAKRSDDCGRLYNSIRRTIK